MPPITNGIDSQFAETLRRWFHNQLEQPEGQALLGRVVADMVQKVEADHVQALVEATIRRVAKRTRETYVPELAERIELWDKSVIYTADGGLIDPGHRATVVLGFSRPIDSGFTFVTARRGSPVVDKGFHLRALRIPAGFVLCEAFLGIRALVAPGAVPAESLAAGYAQPDYPVAHEPLTLAVTVENVSQTARPARIRAEGRIVDLPEAPTKHGEG